MILRLRWTTPRARTRTRRVTVAVLGNDSGGPANEDQQSHRCGRGALLPPAERRSTPIGSVTYTPNAGFSGEGSFGYTACDSGGACDSATATVTVEAVSACMPGGTDGGETLTGHILDLT